MKHMFLCLFLFLSTLLPLYATENAQNSTTQCATDDIKLEKVAAWRDEYRINTQNATIYTAPNKQCKLDTTIPKDTKLKVLGKVDNYYSISYTHDKETKQGYISVQDVSLSSIDFNFYFTLVCMVAVLLLGRFIIERVKVLRDYNIPEPVVGGVITAIMILLIYKTLQLEFKFDTSLSEPLMLAFFSSIGLSADFSALKKGGKMLTIFLVIIVGALFLQNIVGVGISYAMGVDPLLGMLGGSITMSGGHGTGAAWAKIFEADPYNFSAATGVAMACATFGLVMGGLIGGPVARYLIKKHNLKLPGTEHNNDEAHGFETPTKERLITPISFIESLALIAACLLIGKVLEDVMKDVMPGLNLPTFVYCLFTGVILRNTLQILNIHQVFDREVSVLGNVSLSLFLAFAMMTLNLWQLLALALPLIVILVSQAVLMILYAVFVTFRFCGKDYDAAVLAAGHCGFGLGATPTAMVNMQAVTSHYGPSHMAFIIVPLCGAFFIDIINAIVIKGSLSFLI